MNTATRVPCKKKEKKKKKKNFPSLVWNSYDFYKNYYVEKKKTN